MQMLENMLEISELFLSKYEKLYNSVPTSKEELTDISKTINEGINSNNYEQVQIHQSVIYKCVNKLKSNKSDGNLGFDSDFDSNLPFKVKISCISETAARIAKITIFSTPRGLRNHYWGNSDDFRHGGVKFHTKMNFGLLFQK